MPQVQKVALSLLFVLFSSKCTSEFRALNYEEQGCVLWMHNELRRTVARGQAKDVNGDPLPSAGNMREMYFDETLAEKAREWAKRCVWQFSPDHEAQNLYSMSIVDEQDNLNRTLIRAIQEWYNEIELYDGDVGDYEFSTDFAQFSLVIWGLTERVGCAINNCKDLKGVGHKFSILVCNYEMQGNIEGEIIYKTGKPCSLCKDGYICYKDLCRSKQK